MWKDRDTKSRGGVASYIRKDLAGKSNTVIEYSNNTVEVLGELTKDKQEQYVIQRTPHSLKFLLLKHYIKTPKIPGITIMYNFIFFFH